VKCLEAYNVEVLNPAGLKYSDPLYLRGHYDLHGNPLESSYCTYIYEGATLEPGLENDFKEVRLVEDNTSLFRDSGTLHANVSTDNHKLTVPAGVKAKLAGNLAVGSDTSSGACLQVDGDFEVKGNADFDIAYYNKGYLAMDKEGSVFRLGGNLHFWDTYYCKLTAGTIIFNGTEQQTVTGFKAPPTVILENESEQGVIFNSPIQVSLLFDHKGNRFTLYNSGRGSTFVDYDGDTMLDNVDPEPTVKLKEVTTLNDKTVTVKLIDLPNCANLVFAVYRSTGQLYEIHTTAVSGDTVQQTFAAIPEGSVIKVFFLSHQFMPLCKEKVLYASV